MAPIPTPVRVALGLVATAVEAARTLPDRAVELPVLAVSTALQISLRAQQHYTELALRGDEVLGRLHAPPEEPPSWATFDDELADASSTPARVTEPAPTPAPQAEDQSAGAKSATRQPRVRKKTAAAAKSTAAKPVRAPRRATPSAFDRTETPPTD